MESGSGPEMAAAVLYDSIATRSEEWRVIKSVDEHLALYQRCQRVVRYWKSSLAEIDNGHEEKAN